MIEIRPLDPIKRIERAIDESWEILMLRIASGRVRVNKEASLQLHYASILHSMGELMCNAPGEAFTVELETHVSGKNLDVTCVLGDARAAVELKCFRRASNRAVDVDMYDVLKDIHRLFALEGFAAKRFFCLTDNRYYPTAAHKGYAGSVSIKQGRKYRSGQQIVPGWSGKWKDRTRDQTLVFPGDVCLNWSRVHGTQEWFSLSVALPCASERASPA